MNQSPPAGWPGDDAARDGAPLETGYGAGDARLIAAERVIRQLRALVAALVVRAGADEVALDVDQLRDERLRQLRIVVEPDGVRLFLPPEASTDGPAPDQVGGRDERPLHSVTRSAPGPGRVDESALLHRLRRVMDEHLPDTGQPEAGSGGSRSQQP